MILEIDEITKGKMTIVGDIIIEASFVEDYGLYRVKVFIKPETLFYYCKSYKITDAENTFSEKVTEDKYLLRQMKYVAMVEREQEV